MSILAWIEDQRRLKLLNAPKYNHPASDGSQGLWTRCDNCGVILYIKHLKENQRVCFGCGFHLQMNSQERIDNLIDFGTWRPFDETLSPCDPLEFRDQKQYTERLREAQERTGLQDAIQTGTGMLDGIPIALGVMDFNFMGGSMGSAVGEKITRLIEYATQEGLTLILVCASGGARMQEGILSLMQMAKISAALQVYQSCANLLYISVLTSPTTGGVTASFAMLGDLIFAEPKALIGFAGRRVIEQTLQEQLPDDFQTSEYLLHHGLLDLIVPRSFLKQALSETITLYKDAPLKLSGLIPHGVQQSLGSINQEKVRRNWLKWNETLKREQVLPSSRSLTVLNHGLSEGKTINSLHDFSDLLLTSSSNQVEEIKTEFFSLSELQNSDINFKIEGESQRKEFLVKQPVGLSSLQGNEEFFQHPEVKKKGQQPKVVGAQSEFSYREILLSFYTMFQFLSDEFLFSTAKKFGDDVHRFSVVQNHPAVSTAPEETSFLEKNKVFSKTLENDSDKDLLEKSLEYPDQVEAKVSSNPTSVNFDKVNNENFLNKALSLASNQIIQWRAFYMKAKLEPKKKLLNNFAIFQKKPFLFSQKNDEKYFFYKPVLVTESAKVKGQK